MEVATCACGGCGLGFLSGLSAPACPRCGSSQVTKTATRSITAPEPVPAGQIPSEEELRQQVGAALAQGTPITWRCPFGDGFAVSYTPPQEPPGAIDAHMKSHQADLAAFG